MNIKHACKVALLAMILFSAMATGGTKAEAATRLDSYIDEDLHLTKESSPYEALDGVYVSPGHVVTIDSGVTILFSSGYFYVDQSELSIGSGSSSEIVRFDVSESAPPNQKWSGMYLSDSQAHINSLEIRRATLPLQSWHSSVVAADLVLNGEGASTGIHATEGELRLSSSRISGFSNMGIYARDVEGFMNDNIISNNNRGVFYDGTQTRNFSGAGNSFSSNQVHVFNVNDATTLDFKNNDWGTGGAPAQGSVVGKVLTGYEPSACCSSIIFLPGFQASRLYVDDKKVWEPGLFSNVEKLYLDQSGEPLTPGIHTEEHGSDQGVIDEAFGFNIYKSFIASMNQLVADPGNKVSEFKIFPYDWRKDVFEVVTPAMIDEIMAVADRSKNKKVTLIGHSNGGLVGKVIMDRLKEKGREDIVERFIMVAVPQIGTPVAVAGLLHGDAQDLPKGMGILMSRVEARTLGENMHGAYGLLPSEKYFEEVHDPIITFDSSLSQIFNHDSYGDTVDSFPELIDFAADLSGSRTKPVSDDINTPNILQSSFMGRAASDHSRLDSWVAPETTKVIQIAGWGVDTISSIEYSAKRKLFCNGGVECLEWERKPKMVQDGDEVVVVPSAIIQDEDKYYLNLFEYNSKISGGLFHNRKHGNILEVENLQDFIKNIVAESPSSLPAHITISKPDVDDETKRLHFDIHSPVSISITDSFGNFTGITGTSSGGFVTVKEEVPNSYYMEFGEGKYVGVTGNESYQVKLKGTGSGTFTLNVEESKDGNVIQKSFVDIPVSTSTVAELSNVSNISEVSLKIDMTGDGVFEKEIKPAGSSFDPIVFLNTFKQRVIELKLNVKWEKEIITKIEKIIKFLEKNKKPKASALITKYLEWLDQKIQKIEEGKKKKKEPDSKDLQDIKNQLMLLELL
jgi:pimeloyl-ACP methyl ester carboxylesterase